MHSNAVLIFISLMGYGSMIVHLSRMPKALSLIEIAGKESRNRMRRKRVPGGGGEERRGGRR